MAGGAYLLVTWQICQENNPILHVRLIMDFKYVTSNSTKQNN